MANERVIRIGTELDTSGMLSGINQIRQMLNSISVDSDLFKDINKDLDKITKLSLNIGAALKKGIPEHEMNSFVKSTSEVTKLYNTLPEKIRQVSVETKNIQFSKEALTRLDEIELEVENLGKEAKSILGDDLRTAIRDAIPVNIISNKTLDNILKAKNVVGSFEDELIKVQKATAGAEDNLNRLISGFVGSSNLKLRGAGQLLSDSLSAGTLEQDRDKLVSLASEQEMGVENFNRYVTAIDKYIAARQTSITLEERYAEIIKIVNNAQLTATQKTEQITRLTQEGQQLVNSEAQKVKRTLEETANTAQRVGDTNSKAFQQVSDSAQNTNAHLQKQDSILKQLAARATSLIGIGAVFSYITRGVRDAWNGIKDLDKEFTQIAVVTDKTTSQLWQSFSTYSQMAQALGVTTKDAVATSALYYQQGLDTAEVMTLTAETIKMAQIAGMDFATATNQMTAALRGFNLEMSEAGRVNDIFSTLAAGAAVDTQELAYALTKTASIAESAGMSIDTTSAFLTKMIETTREAPENIGTAMKSIVARFEELKSNPLALTVEVDGEEVVANKVEKAIALAGVRLRDETTGQFRDLDDVFIELAKSWEGLDRNTQRYIATIAAGSRQQSRFIALMDGYDRTLELVEMAQDSEGQSAAQFLKTLDSLDSKLNKISNSLESLYQKFVNSDFFGGLLDSLNNVLQELGELDAGQLASFAMIGTVIINTIINSLRSGIPAFTQVTSVIGSQIGATIQSKLQEKLESTKIGNLTQRFTVTGAMQRVNKNFDTKKEKEKNELKQKSGIIKIEADITGAQEKIKELDKELNKLQTENEKITIDIQELDNAEPEDLKKLLDKSDQTKNEINNINQEKRKVKETLGELEAEGKEVGEKLAEQFEQIDTQIAEESKVVGEAVEQNLGAAMSAAGSSIAMALATAITTAISSGDAGQVLSSGLSTLTISLAPQLLSVIANTAASVVPATIASGEGIGAALGAGINAGLAAAGPALIIAAIGALVIGLVALITNAISNTKTQAQKLEEQLKTLEKRQKELDEIAEKSQADAAIEKVKYKNLSKNIETYEKLRKVIGRTTEENEKIKNIEEQIISEYPELIESYDEAGNAKLKELKAWKEIVELQKESAKLAMTQAVADNLQANLNQLQIAETQLALDKELRANEINVKINGYKDTVQNSIYRAKSNNLTNKEAYQRAFSKFGTSGEYDLTLLDNFFNTADTKLFTQLKELDESSIANQAGNFLGWAAEHQIKTEEDLLNMQDVFNKSGFTEISDGLKEILNEPQLTENILLGFSKLYEETIDVDELFKNDNEIKADNKKVNEAIEKTLNDLTNFYTNFVESFGTVDAGKYGINIQKTLAKAQANVTYDNIQNEYNTLNSLNENELKDLFKENNISRREQVHWTNAWNLAHKYDESDFYDKNAEQLKDFYNSFDTYRQNFLLEQAEQFSSIYTELDKIELPDNIKTILETGDFSAFGKSDLKIFKDFINNNLNNLPEDLQPLAVQFKQELHNQLQEQFNADFGSDIFNRIGDTLGNKFAQTLIDAKIGENAAEAIEQSFDGLETSKIPNIINTIINIDDWGNIQNLYALGAAYMDAGDSAEEATEAVKVLYEQFTNPFTVNLDPDVLADKFKDMAESIQDTAKNFKDLNSAIKEVEENGKLSAQTIIDIVAAGNIEYLAFDQATKAVTINTKAIEDNWKAQMQNAEGTIDLDLQRAKTAIAGLQAQREIEQKKLDILENAAKRGGQITAEEYNQLAKLDNKYAIEVVDGQLNLNYDQLQNDAKFFKDLFNNRTEMYNDLVNQAGYYGEQAWDAFLNHSQEVMKKGDYTAISNFASKWSEITLEENRLASKVRGSSNTAYYFDSSTLEQLTKEQRNKLELIDAEIKAWNGNIERLEKYRNVIKEITNLSLEDYMASTADATEKADKELKDYVSTLERYYNLQKNIETLERKRSKSLTNWKKTGEQKYLDEYIKVGQEEITNRYKLAKLSEIDNQRVLKDLKKDLSTYFTAEQLELLNPDKNGYINTDAFYGTKEYAALTQDSEIGQKIDEIIKNALSQNENNLQNIFDYEDFEEEYIKNYEELIQELEEANRKFDRLANINQALESIKSLQEEAKQANEEYYTTGGREGIDSFQYIKVLAENIQGFAKAVSEENKLQNEYEIKINSNELKDYFYQNPGDGKYYYNPEKTDLTENLVSEDFKKQYDALNELITKYNELVDSGKDLKKQQGELAREIRSTAKSMRQSYSDLITRLADDMATLDQKEIDEVKKKYAKIQEEDEKYLNALQKSIDKQRQLRDQAKSYDDLEEQEKRLALLERDTSGANASEIAALREQIKDARQSLVDTEQDNIVNNISEANTTRKEKMDEETTFLQNVMDERTYDMQYYLDRARDIVDAAINGDTGAYQQMLEIMQKAEAEFYRATAEAQAVWLEDTESNFKQAEDWVKIISNGYQTLATETTTKITEMSNKLAEKQVGISEFSNKIDGVKESIELLDQNDPFGGVKLALQEAINKVDELKTTVEGLDLEIEIPIIYKAVGDIPDGTSSSTTSKNVSITKENASKYQLVNDTSAVGGTNYIGLINTESAEYRNRMKSSSGSPLSFVSIDNEEKLRIANELYEKDTDKDTQWGSIGKKVNNKDAYGKYCAVENGQIKEFYDTPQQLMSMRQWNSNNWGYIDSEGYLNKWDKEQKKFLRFAKGGLVDYTGPAWVDGSPAKPEAFLSVSDTRNIQALTEILSTLIPPTTSVSRPDTTNVKSGDTNIEIHLEIEQISDDYDVEQLLDVMQQRITEASEGNVTIVK